METEFVRLPTIRPFHTFVDKAEELPHTSQMFCPWVSICAPWPFLPSL